MLLFLTKGWLLWCIASHYDMYCKNQRQPSVPPLYFPFVFPYKPVPCKLLSLSLKALIFWERSQSVPVDIEHMWLLMLGVISVFLLSSALRIRWTLEFERCASPRMPLIGSFRRWLTDDKWLIGYFIICLLLMSSPIIHSVIIRCMPSNSHEFWVRKGYYKSFQWISHTCALAQNFRNFLGFLLFLFLPPLGQRKALALGHHSSPGVWS